MSLAWNTVTQSFPNSTSSSKNLFQFKKESHLLKLSPEHWNSLITEVSTSKQTFITTLSATPLLCLKLRHDWKRQELPGLSQFLPQVTQRTSSYGECKKSWICNSCDIKQYCADERKVESKKAEFEGVIKKVLQIPWLLNFCKVSWFSIVCWEKTKVVQLVQGMENRCRSNTWTADLS